MRPRIDACRPIVVAFMLAQAPSGSAVPQPSTCAVVLTVITIPLKVVLPERENASLGLWEAVQSTSVEIRARPNDPRLRSWQEQLEILEDLARHSDSAIARINAIKALRELYREAPDASGFDKLDAVVDFAAKKRARAKKPRPAA